MTAELGAVILAAGAGTRLGGVAKALLEPDGRVHASQPRHSGGLPRRTFLARIVATARDIGLAEAIVVVGPPHGDAVAAHARELGCRAVVNPAPERGMASSVAVGFAALEATRCTAAWLWPVDHPDVAPSTLRRLVAGLGAHDAARPVHAGRGGHPPLIGRSLWPQLVACADAPGGARAVLAAADVADLEVEDRGCIRDVDTAADLEAR